MEQRLSLVTLGVADLERAASFYEDGLGWRRVPGPEGVVFFQLPGIGLALWARTALAEDAGVADTDARFRGVALAYNARSRTEVDAVMGRAHAAGGTVTKIPREVFWGGYAGYFTDRDGHLWEVAHNPFWQIDAEGRVTIGGA
ncbi:MAG: VOC family protein [Flavobacteriaceae bacterium]